MPTPVQCIPVLEEIAPGLPYGNDVFLSDILAQMVGGGADEPLPVADFTINSKIGLTGALYASASSETDAGNGPLVYAWSSLTPGLGIGPAASPTAGFTANAPGQYDILLTVSDAAGHVSQQQQRVQVDRVLHVGGTEHDAFAKLQDAFDWISSNDPANAGKYLIEVHSSPSDAARIRPNGARVHLRNGVTLAVGVDFGAGSFYWSGDGMNNTQISVAAGDGISVTTGTVLALSGLRVTTADGAGAAISGTATATGSSVTAVDCYLTGTPTTVQAANLTGVSLQIRYSRVDREVRMNSTFPVALIYMYNDVNLPAATAAINLLSTNNVAVIGYNSLYCNGHNGTDVAVVSFYTPNAGLLTRVINNFVIVSTAGAGGLVSGIRLNTGATGQVHIAGNTVINPEITAVGLHLVGAVTGTLRVVGNNLNGGRAAILSTADAVGVTALAQVNLPIYGSVLEGPLTNVTLAAGTVLNGGNVQV